MFINAIVYRTRTSEKIYSSCWLQGMAKSS